PSVWRGPRVYPRLESENPGRGDASLHQSQLESAGKRRRLVPLLDRDLGFCSLPLAFSIPLPSLGRLLIQRNPAGNQSFCAARPGLADAPGPASARDGDFRAPVSVSLLLRLRFLLVFRPDVELVASDRDHNGRAAPLFPVSGVHLRPRVSFMRRFATAA